MDLNELQKRAQNIRSGGLEQIPETPGQTTNFELKVVQALAGAVTFFLVYYFTKDWLPAAIHNFGCFIVPC